MQTLTQRILSNFDGHLARVSVVLCHQNKQCLIRKTGSKQRKCTFLITVFLFSHGQVDLDKTRNFLSFEDKKLHQKYCWTRTLKLCFIKTEP